MINRIEKIKGAVFSWPYGLVFVLVLSVYILFTIYINDSLLILQHLGTLRRWFAILFVTFFILVSLLVAITVNLAIIRFRQLGSVSTKQGGFAFLGSLGGVIGGSCPACLAGFFPAIMAFFGLSFGLADLPLYGLEIQIASLILLGVSIYLLTNEPVCKVKLAVKK